jgi:hypothetical protein
MSQIVFVRLFLGNMHQLIAPNQQWLMYSIIRSVLLPRVLQNQEDVADIVYCLCETNGLWYGQWSAIHKPLLMKSRQLLEAEPQHNQMKQSREASFVWKNVQTVLSKTQRLHQTVCHLDMLMQ